MSVGAHETEKHYVALQHELLGKYRVYSSPDLCARTQSGLVLLNLYHSELVHSSNRYRFLVFSGIHNDAMLSF